MEMWIQFFGSTQTIPQLFWKGEIVKIEIGHLLLEMSMEDFTFIFGSLMTQAARAQIYLTAR
jgi:hypothetical protein